MIGFTGPLNARIWELTFERDEARALRRIDKERAESLRGQLHSLQNGPDSTKALSKALRTAQERSEALAQGITRLEANNASLRAALLQLGGAVVEL